MKSKILIIDDDRDFTEATAILLEANGFEVLKASNGQEGFQKVKNESPDLILLDMIMTYKTEGAETAKIISQDAALRSIPIILITGAKKDADFIMELAPHKDYLPVKMILEKPVNPDTLVKTVKTFIMTDAKEHRIIIGQLDKLVEKWKGKDGNLVMILHEIQNHYGYVPRGIAFELSRLLEVPLARIYEVITFYNFFKLQPPGKHTISVCMGTACYLKGAEQILNEIQNILHIKEAETTKDGLFHLQVVRCLGCCGLSPVVMIDGKIYGKVEKKDIMDILSKYVDNNGRNKHE